jgi:hypothetical protein
MKFCPNYQCVAYGHVVYTQTTRCVFCRWDLKPPRMKSEMTAEEVLPVGAQGPVMGEMPADSRAVPKRAHLRPSA